MSDDATYVIKIEEGPNSEAVIRRVADKIAIEINRSVSKAVSSPSSSPSFVGTPRPKMGTAEYDQWLAANPQAAFDHMNSLYQRNMPKAPAPTLKPPGGSWFSPQAQAQTQAQASASVPASSPSSAPSAPPGAGNVPGWPSGAGSWGIPVPPGTGGGSGGGGGAGGSGGGGGGGGSSGTGGSGGNIFVAILNAINRISQQVGQIIPVLSGLGGSGGGGFSGSWTTNITSNKALSTIAGILRATAMNGLSLAQTPGNAGAAIGLAGGAVGGAIGGPAGALVSAASQIANSLMSAAESLKTYNAQLFSTMTGFDLFLMGFKYKLAADLAPSLDKIVAMVRQLIAALEPLIVSVVEVLADLLKAMLPILTSLVKWLDVLLKTIQYVIAWVKDKLNILPTATPYSVANAIQATNAAKEVESIHKKYSPSGFQGPEFKAEMDKALNREVDAGWFRGLLNPTIIKELYKGRGLGDMNAKVADYNASQGVADPSYMADTAKQLSAAGERLKTSLELATAATKANTEEMANKGRESSMFLFTAIDKIASSNGSWQGPMRPNIPGGNPTPNSTPLADQWLNRFIPNSTTPNSPYNTVNKDHGFPVPSPVSQQFMFHDTITVQASDEDNLLAEMRQRDDKLINALCSMRDARWLRMATDRFASKQAMGV